MKTKNVHLEARFPTFSCTNE